MVYVGSGGRKASLEAMTDGHGGQQKRQHNSENESPFILAQEDFDGFRSSF